MSQRPLDEALLAAYFDGLLDGPEEARVHAALAADPGQARDVAALGLVIRAEDDAELRASRVPGELTAAALALWPEEGSVAPVRAALRIAVRWLEDRLAPLADALQPIAAAGVAVRGRAMPPAGSEELAYQVTLGDLPLAIDLEVDGPRQLAIQVRPLRPPPPGLLLRVSESGETRAISSLDAGGASIAALPPGTYDLALEVATVTVGEIAIHLDDTPTWA